MRRRRRRSSLGCFVLLDVVLLAAAALLLWVDLGIIESQKNESLVIVDATPEPTVVSVVFVSPTWTRTSTRIPTPKSSPTPSATPFPPSDLLPPLTLSDIFPSRDLSPLKLDPTKLRILVVTGDVVPARSTDAMIRDRKDDFDFTVSSTKDILSAGDFTIVNLEAPLIKNCPRHESGFMLCGRPGFTSALKAAGVDIVTLENNHIGNYGYAGIVETTKNLDAAKITWVDRFTPAVSEIRGLKFGIVALNGVGGKINRQAMAAQIKEWRAKVDVLVMAIHWGKEYVTVPKIAPGIADDNPIEIAHLAVDAGADLIIGNHPHSVQGVELYKGKFIAYAHGNFIFDQMWSYETRVGVIGRYTFYDRRLAKVEFIPVLSEDYGRPVPMKGKDAQAVLDSMKAASQEIAARPK